MFPLKRPILILALFTLSVAGVSGAHASQAWCEEALTAGVRERVYRRNEVAPNVYHLEFANSRAMAATFLRFQEHYESPQFRGRVFSRTQFKRWYRDQNDGHFTYYRDWGGFNIPSRVMRPFYEGEFRFKTPLETTLLEEFRELYRSGQSFYVIGTLAGDASTLNHEIAHGLYFTNPAYRREVDEVLASIDLTPIHRWLASLGGYHESVLDDEAHAYLATDASEARFVEMGAETSQYREATQRLQAIFARYSKVLANQP